MKTLLLHEGDLVIGPNGYEMATGAQMVAQDLRCALAEPVGNDRFHPGYGSSLNDFVGMPLDEDARFLVEQEVVRVTTNYAAIQQDRIQRDALRAQRSRYSTADVVANVGAVKVTADMDKVKVDITIETLDGRAVPINLGVGA